MIPQYVGEPGSPLERLIICFFENGVDLIHYLIGKHLVGVGRLHSRAIRLAVEQLSWWWPMNRSVHDISWRCKDIAFTTPLSPLYRRQWGTKARAVSLTKRWSRPDLSQPTPARLKSDLRQGRTPPNRRAKKSQPTHHLVVHDLDPCSACTCPAISPDKDYCAQNQSLLAVRSAKALLSSSNEQDGTTQILDWRQGRHRCFC